MALKFVRLCSFHEKCMTYYFVGALRLKDLFSDQVKRDNRLTFVLQSMVDTNGVTKESLKS